MTVRCDLCRSDTLEPVYRPQQSARDLTVHLCTHCGLVQSLPRADRAPRRSAAVSAGADWGNVRYGKGFRTAAAMDLLARHVDLSEPVALLDVGANRGAFARAVLDAAPQASLVAVEPDERIAACCADLERCEVLTARIEDAALETARFDVVHSCHTIEHLAQPARVLADHWRVLKPGGWLLVDAPNIGLIEADDIVEEWFIDKHLFHYSAATLARTIEAAGFEIVRGPDPKDRENLLVLARKADRAELPVAADCREAEWAASAIATYAATRAANALALADVAHRLAQYAPRGLAIWGAGRLFDSLVVHGGFDPALPAVLIDTHLKDHVDARYGRALHGPEILAHEKPSVIVVMSRAFAGEIEALARTAVPGAQVLRYADLMAAARSRAAA